MAGEKSVTLRQRTPRVRDDAFLRFVRSHPCASCGHQPPSQAAHIRSSDAASGAFNPGIGAKPDDRWAIPLCQECHLDGSGALHRIGEKKFFEGWDPFAEASRFFLAFLAQHPDGEACGPRRRPHKRKLTAPRRSIPGARRLWPKGRWPAKGARRVNWRKKQ
jgi:hypothetical protein